MIRPVIQQALEDFGMVEGSPPSLPVWVSGAPVRDQAEVLKCFPSSRFRSRRVPSTVELRPSPWPTFRPSWWDARVWSPQYKARAAVFYQFAGRVAA